MYANLAVTFSTSIIKKQIVAFTGVFQTLFVLGHMAGNFFIYAGSTAFNGYANFLAERATVLWAARIVLITCFIIHVFFALRIYLENRVARHKNYNVAADHGMTSFAKRTMVISGLLVFFFLWLHLADFTFGSKTGEATRVAGETVERELGLYGLVWNSFLISEHWWRPLTYLCVVIFLGLHLSHGIQSIFQTFGFRHDRITPGIEWLSRVGGWIIILGYSSIPLYVNLVKTPPL